MCKSVLNVDTNTTATRTYPCFGLLYLHDVGPVVCEDLSAERFLSMSKIRIKDDIRDDRPLKLARGPES